MTSPGRTTAVSDAQKGGSRNVSHIFCRILFYFHELSQPSIISTVNRETQGMKDIHTQATMLHVFSIALTKTRRFLPLLCAGQCRTPHRMRNAAAKPSLSIFSTLFIVFSILLCIIILHMIHIEWSSLLSLNNLDEPTQENPRVSDHSLLLRKGNEVLNILQSYAQNAFS